MMRTEVPQVQDLYAEGLWCPVCFDRGMKAHCDFPSSLPATTVNGDEGPSLASPVDSAMPVSTLEPRGLLTLSGAGHQKELQMLWGEPAQRRDGPRANHSPHRITIARSGNDHVGPGRNA